jgi:phage tail-like protein
MATSDTRNDPFKGFRFRLEVQGLQVAGFSEAMMPDQTAEASFYREGTDTMARKQSGLDRVTTLTLKRGITDSAELYDWYNSVSQLNAQTAGRKNISIILLDDSAQENARWNVGNARPTKYASTSGSASSGEAMIETLELEFETVTRVK